MSRFPRLVFPAALLGILCLGPGAGGDDQKPATLPSAREMAASDRDVWGEAALRRPGGPSYAFFADLLPPLRYVNTAFRHYPIVLSAPRAAVKARWVSNGSAVNARASKKPMWREVGFPVHFSVGEKPEPFGQDLGRLDGPRYAAGYLPFVQAAYTRGKTVYEQEAFAPVRGPWAARGAVLLRFTARGGPGTLTARLEEAAPVRARAGAIVDEQGRGLLLFDAGWRWDAGRRELTRPLKSGDSALLLVATRPLPPPLPALTPDVYRDERSACVACWEKLLGRGLRLEVPERRVNDAWRALVVGNFLIASGDRMNYSAGNAYDHLYEAECGDAVRALLLYGFTREAGRMIDPLLAFDRHATRYHVAGHKLQLLAMYYWVTRDAGYVRARERVWGRTVDFIISSRQKSNGLLPPDNYAGDVKKQVYSLNSNANCWRGLRDMAAVLEDMGERARAAKLRREARAFREAILAAVAQSERRDVRPPFIPNALFGAEPPHRTLPATRLGSYYDLIAPYILGSEIFGPGSERETWLIEYLRQHGGLALGMIRSTPHQGEFNNEPGANVLYGLRYMLELLRRDERGWAQVGFYGQLAQGMTRETFIGAEGTRFLHGDRRGRSMYLPPNSASNAMFLLTLRYLLVQDWADDAGRPATLRLLYGAPAAWLQDGSVLAVRDAPTMFGAVSFRVEPRLRHGEVSVEVQAPARRPKQFLLRLPLAPDWRVVSAKVGEVALTPAGDGAVDLSGCSGRFRVEFRVEKKKP